MTTTATSTPPGAAARPALKPLGQALAELLAKADAAASLGEESVATFDADGRVLARDLLAELDVPARDNSAMDGYAVRMADQAVAGEGAVFAVSQRIPAGAAGDTPLAAGTVARIFTGAPVPPGADAVVIQEDSVAAGEGLVRFTARPVAGQNIRRAGEDIAQGQVVLARGRRLSAADIGLAASIGAAALPVGRRPRVALLSTGDELAMPGEVAPQDLPPGGVFNSNRFFLRTLLQRLGCEVSDLGIVPDDLAATQAILAHAAQAHDVVVTSGGVSVGEEDHVKPAVQALGSLELWQVAIKPGKPFAYGRLRRGPDEAAGTAHFIGLPGNPVSSYVTGLLLLRPFLLRLQGVADVLPRPVAAVAAFEWTRPDPKRRDFLRVRVEADGRLGRFGNQGSGVLTSVAWADGVIDNPPGRVIQPGDTVRYIPFAELA
ncbi:MAG: Molybdopterin molybdenumtransferase [Paracidovorax wautersii]|uniref:Molybdopterin molybdenumtransferase n=1 Tax=Paracidovorax wautersii TaxID=1177982 RepID=A0A7V8JNI7_9BURK|nr:MAG: Molybdopterin molybdenumtransferase [Paracidovorax wautersii]